MSRNIRHKSNLTSPKRSARRVSKTSDNSSDEDYAGVDLISDSEEDEPEVEVAEEQAIIESAEDEDADEDDSVSTPRPSGEDDQSNWDGFSMDASQEVLDDDLHFFEDHMSRMHDPDHDIDAALWASKNATSGSPEPRRVRFNLSDSSSTASDNDDVLYPDLFMDQDSLAPSFRRKIENDDDDQNQSSDDGSCWDFDGERPVARDSDEESNASDSTGSSGYETDSGDTTEEEDPPESIRKERYLPPRSVLRRQSTDSGSEEEIAINRRVPPRSIRGPRLGSWIHNASRPFAVINSDGNRLYMFKARVNRRFSHSDLRPHLNSGLESEGETAGELTSPMASNSGNLMLSAMYTPLGPYLNNLGDSTMGGPPEAFYPIPNGSGDILQQFIQDGTSSLEEDEVDDEELWDVEDFINFGEQSSDDEGDADEPVGTPRPVTASSDDQGHSNLLNPGIVGAFRKNQQKHKLMTRYNATVDSLVFAGPYAATTLRGIKDGRIAHAATAITPLRKQKAPPIDSSPLAAHSNKRKFSGEERGHKRSKSMN